MNTSYSSYHQTYYEKNRDEIIFNQRCWYEQNRDRQLAYMREYNKAYHLRKKARQQLVGLPTVKTQSTVISVDILSKNCKPISKPNSKAIHKATEKYVEDKQIHIVKGMFTLSFD